MTDTIEKNYLAYFISGVIPSIITYVFWIVVGYFTNSEIIGTVALVVTFSTLFSVLSSLDLSVGMRRFLGIAKEEGKMGEYKQIVSSSILFSLFISIITILIVLNPIFNLLEVFGVDEKFIPIIIVIIISDVLIKILIATLISSLKSHKLIIPNIVASLSKFVILSVVIYNSNFTDIELVWSYSISYVVLVIFLAGLVINYLNKFPEKLFSNIKNNIKLVTYASLSNWVPHSINLIGSQFSILIIYAYQGSNETGLFYMAFILYNFILMIPSSIYEINYPVMSGMQKLEKQKVLLQTSLKLGFLGSMPVAAILFFYGDQILTIFGNEFSSSQDMLSILILSIPFAIISHASYYLIYARGNYKTILFLGLSVNIPRLILYLILVPIFGGFGAAISFISGYFIQFILTVIIIEKLKLRLVYKKFILISIIPFILGYVIEFLKIDILGIIPLIVFSLLIFLKMKLLNEEDIKGIFRMIMNHEKSELRVKKITKILRKIHCM